MYQWYNLLLSLSPPSKLGAHMCVWTCVCVCKGVSVTTVKVRLSAVGPLYARFFSSVGVMWLSSFYFLWPGCLGFFISLSGLTSSMLGNCPKARLQPKSEPGNRIKVLENAYILGYNNHLKYWIYSYIIIYIREHCFSFFFFDLKKSLIQNARV